MWNKSNGCIIEFHGSGANGANVRVEEIAEYLKLKGEQLYCVHHLAEKPRAQIVLAGPFASERSSRFPTERDEAQTRIVPGRTVSDSDEVEVRSTSLRTAVV